MIGKVSLIVAVTFFAALPAQADCGDDLKTLHKSVTKFKSQTVFGGQLRKLRTAASTFHRLDRNDACEETVAHALDIIETRKEQNEKRREKWREKKRYQSAMSVRTLPGLVITSSLHGIDVYNLQAEELGVVEDVALDPNTGDIGYLVLSHGGILGVAESHTPVPWQLFRVTDDKEEFVLDISVEQLDKAPSYNWGEWPANLDKDWRSKVATYFAQ